jgi:protocatechuate 3,4-dioxygenase beta subunit
MKWPLILAPLILIACAENPDGEPFRRFAKPIGGTEWSGAAEAPTSLSWQTRFDQTGEAGEPLIVSGTIFKPDGKTPAAGVLLYAYHTDSKGSYSRGRTGPGNERRHGILRGWVHTGPDGKYEFRTIRPAPYPGRTAEAHIHATLTGDGFPEHWIPEFLFDGDPLTPARVVEESRKRGAFANILKPVKGDDGIWRARRNLKLELPSRSNGGA